MNLYKVFIESNNPTNKHLGISDEAWMAALAPDNIEAYLKKKNVRVHRIHYTGKIEIIK